MYTLKTTNHYFKKIKEYINIWKNITHPGIWRLNTVERNTPQVNLQTQCNLLPNPSWLLCINWQADSKIHMKFQVIQDSQNNLERGKQRGLIWFRNLLLSNSHQDSIILAEGLTYRSMWQNWEFTYKPLCLYINK